jgi:hypothetical protein
MRAQIQAAQAEVDRIESEGDFIVDTVGDIETGGTGSKQ